MNNRMLPCWFSWLVVSALFLLAHLAAAAEPDKVKIALVAMHSEMGQPEQNLKRVAFFAKEAHQQGATFVVFTEECITGSLNKSQLSPAEIDQVVQQASKLALPRLEELAKEYQQTLLVGTILPAEKRYRNAVLVVGPKGLLTTYDKLWLPNQNEAQFFRAGTELPVITSQGWQFSVGICADLDRGEYFDAASRAGAELFLLPIAGSGFGEKVSSIGDQTEQAAIHRALHEPIMCNWGRRYAMYIGYANQAGHSGNDWFPGLSLAVDPRGELLGVHSPNEGLLVVEAAREVLAQARAKLQRPADPLDLKNSAGEAVTLRRVPE